MSDNGRWATMSGMPQQYRLYQDLAAWWPLISPPVEYTAESAYLAALLAAGPGAGAEVLDLGSGGGNVAAHLKPGLAMTLVDLSAQMLAVSRELNPECEHRQGDMRTIRLGRVFDAVLVHDAVDYMTTEDDLRQVIETAWAHCAPGGLALFVPDYTADTFAAASGHGGSSDADGRQASFREWTWDPDPADSWIQSEYEFVLRAADGSVQVVSESHRLGAFSSAAWSRLLAEAGFDAGAGAALEAAAGLGGADEPDEPDERDEPDEPDERDEPDEPDERDEPANDGPRRPQNLFVVTRPAR
jgi:SAM-dependent methyltransferase